MSTTLPEAPAGHVTCPDCRLGIDGPAAGCPRCGAALPPPGSPAVWREGRHVVALRDSILTDRCVRCGEPGDGRPIRHRVHWHHWALYLLVFLWVVPYIVVALAVRRSATVRVSVCERHRRIRDRALQAAWGLLGAGIAGLAAARVEDRLVRLRGAGAAFRDLLPDWSAPGGGVVPAPAVAAPRPPAPAAEGGTAALGHILAETWPELAADRGRAAEYEWALDGLAPGVVAAVAASFAAERRPLPTPAVLRMAVMARARAEAPGALAALRPAVSWTPSPAPADAGSRRRAGVPMSVCGAAAVLAFIAAGLTWATVRAPGVYATHRFRGPEVDGGPLVVSAALVAFLAVVAGAVLILRRDAARSVGIAFAVAAVAHVFAILGGVLAFGDIGQARDQMSTALTPSELAMAEVAPGPGLWTALVAGFVGAGAGVYGHIRMRRRDEA